MILLTQVLERKTGIPISMCTVYQSIGNRLGITLPAVSNPYKYSMYYKPMGDLPYISSEWGWAYNTSGAYLPYISILYLYKNFELKRGVGL